MTYTAWDYRKLAEYHEQLGNAIIAKHYLAFADTLEELARINSAWKAQQFHLEREEKESERWMERAERAEAELAAEHKRSDALIGALEQFANNNLSEANCGSVELAGRRVANIARIALNTARRK